MTDTFAGAAVVDITPGAGIAMGGYGARTGVSTDIHDPLFARVSVFSDGTTKLALAVCDLVGVTPDLVARARSIIEQESGIPGEHVCISATHTHSGPMPLRAEEMADYVSVTARKIAGAVAIAARRLQPVTLKYGETQVSTISQNRRHPDGPIETTGKVLLAAPGGGGAAVATLLNYACHATVLEHDNLLYSADFPGAAARTVERALGGVCVYVQGACGDINPVWMRHDFAEVERVGGILGAAAARTGHELRPLDEGQWGINLSWSEETPKEPAPGTVLAKPAFAAAATTLQILRRVRPSVEEVTREMAGLERRIEQAGPDDIETRRSLRPRLNELRMHRAYWLREPDQSSTTLDVPLQAFRLSNECAMIALPGEFFVELARDIERAAGVKHLIITGYANDSVGYVPTEDAFPLAGYEIGSARHVQEAAGIIVGEAAKLVQSLY